MEPKQVFYNGKAYIVIYKYNSGYWEIREIGDTNKVELVHKSEIDKENEEVNV